jgi:hypothetical protein
MAMFGSGSVTITYDDSPGGTGRAITQYVREIGGIKVEALQARSESFGDVWQESTPTGMKMVGAVSIKGYYDDAATSGPHVVFRDPDDGPSDSTRTLVVVFGGTNGTFTIETRLVSYEVLGKNGGLTEYEAVVQPTGSGAWS